MKILAKLDYIWGKNGKKTPKIIDADLVREVSKSFNFTATNVLLMKPTTTMNFHLAEYWRVTHRV